MTKRSGWADLAQRPGPPPENALRARRAPGTRIPVACMVALLACGLWAGGAHASLVRALSLAELVSRADLVVLARAQEQQARRHPDGRMIVSDVSLRVEQSLKGDARPGDTLVATRLGGALEDLAMQVPGEARFAIGQRAIVFLYVAQPYGELHVVGMAQGVMPVEQEGEQAMVTPGGAGAALVQRDADGRLREAAPALVAPEPLTLLLSRIRALVRDASRAPGP